MNEGKRITRLERNLRGLCSKIIKNLEKGVVQDVEEEEEFRELVTL